MKKNDSMAAAISAVISYIKAEKRQGDTHGINRWGVSGRQFQMQTRNQMQSKSFHGWKLR